MNKQQKINTVIRMLQEINIEVLYGGFNEMDQTQIEFQSSSKFLNEVSVKGLEMLMDLIEESSKAGVNRKNPLTEEDIMNQLNKKIYNL